MKYIQFTHLINFKKFIVMDVLIAGNTFRNLSMTGPLINFMIDNHPSSSMTLLKNEFSLIHSYHGSAIASLSRKQYLRYARAFLDEINDDPDLQTIVGYFLVGGGYHIEGNSFSEIVGCQFVDASLFSISVIDS